MKREEAVQLTDRALSELTRALEQGHSEELVTYLSTMAKFHRYSFGNCLLIAVQKPDATRVAGYTTWKKLGRQVRKGEKGIAILAPIVCRAKRDKQDFLDTHDAEEQQPISLRGFKVAHVFDVSQTEGTSLPEFAAVRGEPGQHLAKLKSSIVARGIQLQYGHIPGGAFGASTGGTIIIRPNLEPPEEFAVLVHELAHELLHTDERRDQTTKTIRETEAEAVAFVVSRAVGLESSTRSSDYIQLYRGTTETLATSLGWIQKTANSILTQIEGAV
jgi:antirestriction protein ArdC